MDHPVIAVATENRAVFPGTAEHVPAARRWLRRLLNEGEHPAAYVAEQLTSEVVGNAIEHSRSGQTNGEFLITVAATDDSAHVTVYDQGSDTIPHIGAADLCSEGGRGLFMVDQLATMWAVEPTQDGWAVSFLVSA